MSPKSPSSPMSPNTRARKKVDRHAKGALDFGSRPSSADSETRAATKSMEAVRQATKDKSAKRSEKPLAAWAELFGVPFDIARQALDDFIEFVSKPPPQQYRIERGAILGGRPFDASTDLGSMDHEAFGKVVLRIADAPDFSVLPEGFLEQAMKSADKDNSNDIDFREFLYFYYKFSFSEECMIGAEEREQRIVARECGISPEEIGIYRRKFDEIDVDKNGTVDYEEFTALVRKLLKIPKGEDLPEKRCKDMWREASRGSHGADIDFMTFVGWYKSFFDVEECGGETPAEAYYHNVRRVPVYVSDNFH